MAVDPITGQEIAPTGAAGQGEAIPPEPTIPTAPVSDGMVTIPSAVKPDEEKLWEFQADGGMRKVNEEKLIELAQKGWNYTGQVQQLAPYKEMRDFIEENPGAADAIVSLMQQGVPQQRANQMVQEQAAPTGYPQQQMQPQMDPNFDFLLNQVAGVQFQLESQTFQSKHPDAKLEEVAQYMLDRNRDNLEDAYRDMNYDEIERQAALYRQEHQQQNQATAVEPGAQGPPDQIRVDPRKLTPEQISEIAKLYNFIE